MFDYVKETIINSADRVNATTTQLSVTKTMDYKVASIENKEVFRTLGTKGTYGTIKFTPTSTVGKQKLELTLKSVSEYPAEFATAIGFYTKPIVIEYATGGSASATADNIIKAITSMFNSDYRPITVKFDTGQVVITSTEKYILFDKLTITKLTFDANLGDYTETVESIVPTIVQSVMNFGDYEYIMHNHRFPTRENMRWMGTNSDDMPVKDGLYNQYTFKYVVERTHTGMGTIGQKLTSITTHIFYVLSTVATEFEAELKIAGLTIKEYVIADNNVTTEEVI